MNYIIITAYGEPKATEKAINKILPQAKDCKIIVADPFPEVHTYLKEKFQDKIQLFLDPDEGKSYALNLILKNIYSEDKNSIIIMTDGDVYLSDNAIEEMLDIFKDEKIGIATGHPSTLNSRKDKFGFWSHLLLDEMNVTRILSAANKKYMECSGYLFGIRNGVVKEFPLGASEDSILPILFWRKGYKVGYSTYAKVFVLNPSNFKDWVKQKKRNIKGHLALEKIIGKVPVRQSFLGEVLRGFGVMFYPKSVKEYYYFGCLLYARLYAWFYASRDKGYKDGWREEGGIESTRTED